MASLKKYFKNFLDRIVAGSNNNKGVALRFGRIESMLVPSRRLYMKAGYTGIDSWNMPEWKKRNGDFCIYPRMESNPHIIISGMSGFGKSTLFKSLLRDIRKEGMPCIIFDAHNEHNDMVRDLGGRVHDVSYSGINIMELDGASVSERISELSRLLKDIYGLGYIQATKLSDCMWYTYRKSGARSRSDRTLSSSPTVKDLMDELSIFIKNSKTAGERNTLLHLRDRISLLNSPGFTNNIRLNDIQSGLHSFSLASMKSREAQLVYIGELLSRIYSTMHDGKKYNSLRLYIMIDEAQFLTDSSNSNSVVSKLIEEGRKYGIGVIMVTHAASGLNKKIIANASAFITFYAREPTEVSFIAKVLSGSNPQESDSIRSKINSLKQSQAIMVCSSARSPVLLATPKFSDMAPPKRAAAGESEAKELLLVKAKTPIALAELRNFEPMIEDGMISNLVGMRFIDYFDDGYDKHAWIMIHKNSISVEHEVWVKRISRILDSCGISNKIVDNSTGPDIIGSASGTRFAVEYETGYKRISESAKMIKSRLGVYGKVLVVTSGALVGQYEKALDCKEIIVLGTDMLDLLAKSIMDT